MAYVRQGMGKPPELNRRRLGIRDAALLCGVLVAAIVSVGVCVVVGEPLLAALVVVLAVGLVAAWVI